MTFIAAAKKSDIPPGSMIPVTVDGKKLLLANVGEVFHAISATCPHLGADLCKGKLVGTVVTCPKHGASFDVTDGHTVGPAKILFLKMQPKKAASFTVKVENEQILIEV